MTGNDSQQERCDIRVTKVNDVYLQVHCEKSIRYELADYFSFYAPGYKFHPKFKAKFWDGKIRLCRIDNGVMYYGLHKEIKKFASERDYSISFDETFNQDSGFTYDQRELDSAKFQPRDYQVDATSFALKNKRCVLVSPTGSGKSFIIYMIMKHLKKRTLIVVPTISLVHQLADDFIGYNPKTEKWIHKITAGESKNSNKPITISTWQSIYQQPPEWFEQFEVVVGDECHQFKASSLSSIMEKCKNIEWRIGTTGTISNADSKVHALTLQGLFGDIKKISSTKELMDQNYLSDFKIKVLILKYDEETSKQIRKLKYQDEMDFLVNYEKRNNFIANLAASQTNNTLVLFQYVEKHGKPLFDLISEKAQGKNVYFVSGEVDGVTRETIRKAVRDGQIELSFGDKRLKVDSNALIPLEDGSFKEANKLTTEDDISNDWLRTKNL